MLLLIHHTALFKCLNTGFCVYVPDTLLSVCILVDRVVQGVFLNLRFRMFRLSSSSTFGLWLSLLRRNTKTTFCTISDFSRPLNWLYFFHCARSREGSPYVSISHPNRGCGASAEALPTSGTVEEARLSCLRILHQVMLRSADAASHVVFTLSCPPRTTGAFELGRDGLLRRDSPSFPGYCMHNLWKAEPPTHGIPNLLLMHTGLLAQSLHLPFNLVLITV